MDRHSIKVVGMNDEVVIFLTKDSDGAGLFVKLTPGDAFDIADQINKIALRAAGE